MSARPAVLVIGVGNRDRGDDAVGPVVCDLLDSARAPGVETLVFEGSVVDLSSHWGPDDRVIVVDAAAPAGRPGFVSETDGLASRLTAPAPVSTHAVDVGAAVELARAVGRLPATLRIVGIEGESFDFGDDLRPAVHRSALAVARRIASGPNASTFAG